jgi:hypothetical protein
VIPRILGTREDHKRPEPVIRRYRPGSADLGGLVEVLYMLLVDVPADESAMDPSSSGAACFTKAPE